MKKNKLVLLLLITIFLLPGIAAYVVYLNPAWIRQPLTNQGKLLSPPQKLMHAASQQWHLLLEVDQCDEICLKQLDKLARIRLALGRRLYEVNLLLVLADKNSLTEQQIQRLKTQAIQVMSTQELPQLSLTLEAPQVYLVNPQGYAVLAYPVEVDSAGIFKDMKHLLATSGTK